MGIHPAAAIQARHLRNEILSTDAQRIRRFEIQLPLQILRHSPRRPPVISLKDILRGWNRFFFEPQSPLPVAVYRILLGLIILANHALLLPDVDDWFSDRGSL